MVLFGKKMAHLININEMRHFFAKKHHQIFPPKIDPPKPFLLHFYALIFLDIKIFEKILEIFFEIILFLFFMCHIFQFSVCFKVFWKSTIQINQSRHNFVLF